MDAAHKLGASIVNKGKIKKCKKKRINPNDYSGCKKYLVQVYLLIRFMISNSDELMDTDTQRLYNFEPENDRVNKFTKYIKKITFFVLAFVSSLWVIITNIGELGNIKVQEVHFSNKVELKYEMNSNLIPVH